MLDDADPEELAGSIKYVDGRHDHYDKTPEDTAISLMATVLGTAR